MFRRWKSGQPPQPHIVLAVLVGVDEIAPAANAYPYPAPVPVAVAVRPHFRVFVVEDFTVADLKRLSNHAAIGLLVLVAP